MKKCARTCKKQVSLKKLEERGANCIEEEEATETLLLQYSELKEGQYMKGRGVEVVYHMGKVIPQFASSFANHTGERKFCF